MSRKPQPAIASEKAIRSLLERYACPVPWHEVRTRFLGHIAAPVLTASPLQNVQDLWGGDLPVFETLDEANELIGTLVQGLWNSLTRHQKRSEPFRLVRLATQPTPADLARVAMVRRQELDGFIAGLFNGQDSIDLPERAHGAVGHLSEIRAMMAGIEHLVLTDAEAESRTELEATFRHVAELTRIMETEIHEAVLSCTRARRQMQEAFPLQRPTFH